MTLAAGDKLGPYEIISRIGKGGMGEVYSAHDPRTGRDVAIKVSAERFNERFDREVRAVAALNHPNICTLFDVGPNYLVMELVEGEAPQGPLPLEEALRIAGQIAEALEAAHEKGITHRDLKPGNIKVKPDGTVKVLDFGLAKMGGTPGAPSENSPTISMAATQAGVILGTAAYMAPEQAKGKPVDKRADIWAFGVVLYEMLTGRKLFRGETTTEILAAVLTKEPDWDRVPAQTRPLLRRCLEKDAKRRLHDIADAMPLLEVAPEPEPRGLRHKLAWGGFTIATVVALVLAFFQFRQTPSAAEPVRFQILAPNNTGFGNSMALSPDGRQVAFIASGRLWIRPIDSVESRVLAGTDNAYDPFWSPDSRFIAFVSGTTLKKVEAVGGGPPQIVCEVTGALGRGTWNRDGVILFGGAGSGPLRRVLATGGAVTSATAIDPARQEIAHEFPSFLPDGRHFVYRRASANAEYQGIYVGSLDAKPEEQSSKRLLATQFDAVYAPSGDSGAGRLLFIREGTLMAQPFDPGHLELGGEAAPVAEQVQLAGAWGIFSAVNGALAYLNADTRAIQLTWLDRQGNVAGRAGEPQYSLNNSSFRLAPDGKRVAEVRIEAGNSDVWLLEFARGVPTRFTFDPRADRDPVWSLDGNRIAFRSNRRGPWDLYQKTSGGAGNDETLFQSAQDKTPTSWSSDGRFLLYNVRDPKTKDDIWALPSEGDRKPFIFLNTVFNELDGQFSPDNRWVAYSSDASGKSEIYVRPFAHPGSSGSSEAGDERPVSTAGGAHPRWSRDGKELFYAAPDQTIMVVEVNANPLFRAGIPKRLFPMNANNWDVTADGKRFLVPVPVGAATPSPITVVLNWQAGLKK